MKIRNAIAALLCVASVSAFAVPARRGLTAQMQQPDGTSVCLQLVGDEYCHYYLTDDNKVVISDEGKYVYASIDAYDNLVNTGVLAHDALQRSAFETSLVDAIDASRVKAAMSLRHSAQARINSQDGKGVFSNSFPSTGTVKSLVFLVSYDDLDFSTDDTYDYFYRLLNEEGFSANNASGSVRDYFSDASMGVFTPEFDLYGPIKLPKNRAYYGANFMGADIRPKEMIMHAAQLLDETVDFSQYDTDGDGYVDNVYVFYAGKSEAEYGGDDCVWPHQGSIGTNSRYRFDDVYFNHYACGSELVTGNGLASIGTFCHEFSHVLGLPDLYNTIDASAEYTPLEYSVLDQGCYLSNGTLPPTYSAFERNALRWMGDNLVEITGPASCTLPPLNESNKAYLINTDNPDEFFIFENRQKKGWDKRLPYHGMLIWHIDFNKSIFLNNKPNNDPNHQCVDLIEANAPKGKMHVPFPGLSKVKEFTYDSTPAFSTWSGIDLGLPITDIKENNSIITFNVAGGGADPASVSDILTEKDFAYTVVGHTINVDSDGLITIADLSGRVLAQGYDAIQYQVTASGVYIISSPSGSAKIAIK